MKRALAALIFLVVPVAAYISGKNLTGHVSFEAKPAIPQSPAAPSTPSPPEFSAGDVGHLQGADLFRALESSGRARKDVLVREACALSDRRKRGAAISSLFKCFAMLNTNEAVSLLEALDREQDKIKGVEAVIRGAPTPATPAMIDMLMSLSGPVGEECRNRWLSGQLRFWSAFDPAATAQFIDAHLDRIEDISRTALISNWAAVDPAAAQAWLAGHSDLTGSQAMVEELVYGVYQHDPEMAQQYVRNNATDERFQGVIGAVARFTFFQSSEAAEKFITSLPDAAARRRALGSVAGIDLEFLAAQKGSNDRLAASVADWILRFPPEDRSGSIARLTQEWQRVDSPGLFQWMRDLGSQSQAEVIGEYATGLNSEGLSSVLTLPDARLRTRLLGAFLATGGTTAAEQERFVKELSLSDNVQKELLANIVR